MIIFIKPITELKYFYRRFFFLNYSLLSAYFLQNFTPHISLIIGKAALYITQLTRS